eukprot:435288-Hanusia_phi.AAC.1
MLTRMMTRCSLRRLSQLDEFIDWEGLQENRNVFDEERYQKVHVSKTQFHCGMENRARKSTYFRCEAAGNQSLGSTVAGLRLYKSDFARLRPTFDYASAEARNCVDKTIGGMFLDVFPPEEYLKSAMPRNHVILETWRYRCEDVLCKLKDVYGWTGTVLPAGIATGGSGTGNANMDQSVGGVADEQNTQESLVHNSGNVAGYSWKGGYHPLPEGFQWKAGLLEQTKRLSCGWTAQLNMDILLLRR